MEIAPWPIVPRQQVVRAFSPGHAPKSDSAYRTLKGHGWASDGVNFAVRSRGKLAGTLTLFSRLNLESVWLARVGDSKAAVRFAKAAKSLESSHAFKVLESNLSSLGVHDAEGVLNGNVPGGASSGLWKALRELAQETERQWSKLAAHSQFELVTGRVSEIHESFVVVHSEGSLSIAVPRWMAVAIRRDAPGSAMAVVTERLDQAGVMMEALPALEMEERPPVAFSPFGRPASPPLLSAGDEQRLKGRPAELKILVPVTIEA